MIRCIQLASFRADSSAFLARKFARFKNFENSLFDFCPQKHQFFHRPPQRWLVDTACICRCQIGAQSGAHWSAKIRVVLDFWGSFFGRRFDENFAFSPNCLHLPPLFSAQRCPRETRLTPFDSPWSVLHFHINNYWCICWSGSGCTGFVNNRRKSLPHPDSVFPSFL